MGAVRPAYADSLLEDAVPPQKPGSLSHFFYSMSQGDHRLKGFTYPHVVVSDTTIAEFRSLGADIRRANRHILKKLADGGFDFSQFDESGGVGGDGTVDYIFIQWQAVRTVVGTTVVGFEEASRSTLLNDSEDLTVGQFPDQVTITPGSGSTLMPPRIEFDPCDPGDPTFVRHRWMVTAIAAHEYGHDLQTLAGQGCLHVETESRYGLMNGSMTPPVMMMSSLLRKDLGWIEPVEIDYPSSFPFTTTLTLNADYEAGNDCFAIIHGPPASGVEEYFILEARKPNLEQRPYNAPNPVDFPQCCYPMRDVGEGLLVAHVRSPGVCCFRSEAPGPPAFDIEIATGRFDPSTGEPDPTSGFTRTNRDGHVSCSGTTCGACASGNPSHLCVPHGPATGRLGDLFKPSDGSGELFSNLFTPFTNPNTNFYGNGTSAQTKYTGISIYDIQWGPGQSEIEVKIRIDGPLTRPNGADTLFTDMTLDGHVQLTADLVVPEGVTLTIAAGATVVVAAEMDRHSGGEDPDHVGIIVFGELDVQGTIEAPVRFMSSRDAGFASQEFRDWTAAPAAPAPGDWGGLWFDQATTAMTGPGGAIVYGTASRIENAEFNHASVGIGIRKTGAPSIVGTTFSQIANDFHVLVDSTDVYVPYLGEWTFEPSTRVKMRRATRAGQDISVGSQTLDAGKVNVVVHGGLNANGVQGSLVYFEPDVVPTEATVGDEWGGILFEGITLGSVMSWVDIGYAIKPLTLVAQDAIIENAWIHHFRDRGVWFYSYVPNSAATGPQLRLSSVYRDAYSTATLDVNSGFEAIVLEVCPDFRVVGNQISLSGANKLEGGAGIRILNSQTFCSKSPPAGTDSAVVAANQVSGPGGDAGTFSPDWRGVQSDWACGSNAARVVYFYDNQIDGWKDAAFRFMQSSDVQVSCNETMNVVRGVDFFRDDVPTGNGVRFRGNVLEVGDYSTSFPQSVVRTDDALMLKLGPMLGSTPPNKGLNELTTLGADWYAIENDSDSAKELNADDNLWTRDGTVHSAEVDILQYVTTEIAEPAHVSAAGAGPWYPLVPPCPGGSSGALQGQDELALQDDTDAPIGSVETALRLSGDVPSQTRLDQASPSPFADATRIRFDLGGAEVRDVSLEVFDVRGRLVRRLLDATAPGGRYEVRWNARRESGKRLAAGVYFIRLTTTDLAEVQKVVVLR